MWRAPAGHEMHDEDPTQRDLSRSGQADDPYRASGRRRMDDYRPPSLLAYLLRRPRAILVFLVRRAPVLLVDSLRVQGRSDDPAAAGACLERFELAHRPSVSAIVVVGLALAMGAMAAGALFEPTKGIGVGIFCAVTSVTFGYGGFLMHAQAPRWVELHEHALVFERRRHVECVPWSRVSMVRYVPDTEGDDFYVVRIGGRLSLHLRATSDGTRAARAIEAHLDAQPFAVE